MKVSIITPTSDREQFLRGLYSLLKKQTYSNWEWLIYDTSTHPQHFSDARIDYTHSSEILSIGEKRNLLAQKAKGDIIVQCDDDDYYAPTYLEFVLKHLQNHAFFTLDAWFSYDLKTSQTFYRVLNEQQQTHYIVNAISGPKVREIDVRGRKPKQQMGYGFSFAYRKEVLKKCSFSDHDLGEDRLFYKDIEKAGFPIVTRPDYEGQVIHIIHDMNTSSDYPQYRIPHFLVKNLFPEFFTHIKCYED